MDSVMCVTRLILLPYFQKTFATLAPTLSLRKMPFPNVHCSFWQYHSIAFRPGWQVLLYHVSDSI